jgi:hypothetical protein
MERDVRDERFLRRRVVVVVGVGVVVVVVLLLLCGCRGGVF